MQECDKTAMQAANFLSVYLLIMINILLLRPALHFTTLHPTSLRLSTLHFPFKLPQLHFTNLSFGLTPFKFPTAPFHVTTLHLTSIHLSSLLFLSLHPIYNCFPNSLFKSFRFTRETLMQVVGSSF
jgi:hypothetical protein